MIRQPCREEQDFVIYCKQKFIFRGKRSVVQVFPQRVGNMLKKLDSRLLGLRFVSIVICLLGLMRIKFFISLGALFTSLSSGSHVDRTNVISLLTASYEMTAELVKAASGWQSDLLISYIIIGSFLGSILYVFGGVFLFLRKSWARKAIIFYSIYVLLNTLMIRVLTHTFKVGLFTVLQLIFNIALVLALTNKSTIALFNPQPKSNLSKQDN
jgi:hypothetical protein